MKLDILKTCDSFGEIKKQFPIFKTKVNGKNLVYLDSAASAQKPEVVIDSMKLVYENKYANVHRGIYYLSQIATDAYESSREKIKSFLNASFTEEIIFTRGATEGINLVANCLMKKFISEGDEVLISTLEHHSNIIPWQIVCEQKKAKLTEVKPSDSGDITLGEVKKMISKKSLN